MFKTVSNWLGATFPEDSSENKNTKTDSSENKPTDNSEAPSLQEKNVETDESIQSESEAKPSSRKNDIFDDIDEVSAKAVETAKEWGSILFQYGKTATEQVSKKAKQLKEQVEERTILGDFDKEQSKFVNEKVEKERKADAAVAPWIGYNEEETMKTQILALSSDKRNFLRNPPAGVEFSFDYEASHPVAMVLLEEDADLKDMRFQLVPKQIAEELFWRNYFYRVSLIKQSAQLSSLAQETGNTSECLSTKSSGSSRKSSIDSVSKAELESIYKASHTNNERNYRNYSGGQYITDASRVSDTSNTNPLPSTSPPEHDFASDAFQSSRVDEGDIQAEMEQLGMVSKNNTQDNTKLTANLSNNKSGEVVPDWEKELQAELNEYEVVADDLDNSPADINDPELEQEILKQIEEESQETNS